MHREWMQKWDNTELVSMDDRWSARVGLLPCFIFQFNSFQFNSGHYWKKQECIANANVQSAFVADVCLPCLFLNATLNGMNFTLCQQVKAKGKKRVKDKNEINSDCKILQINTFTAPASFALQCFSTLYRG